MEHFLKNLFKKKEKQLVRRAWPRSKRDWEILLGGFLFLLIAGAIASGFLFLNISRGEIFQIQKSSQDDTSIIDSELLKKTIDFYENKALNLKEITTHSKVIGDPSL
ncbi:MAG: hypothetical protein PHS53_01880 [Candidatus Pacebacteria bacterium]|nr:hypothetical protein [Candidatus Paceibacterota bacterium]MDD5356877.1 hypothetical protein [Candidatus Paceibacterota bacterium]